MSTVTADDFGVELKLDRMDPHGDPNVLYEKMAAQIESLCKAGVDGIFVTIPNEIVLDEIELCLSLNVPVVSINAGPEYSKGKGEESCSFLFSSSHHEYQQLIHHLSYSDLYHHIGMVEWNAGVQAGKRLASTGQMKKALCLMHAPTNVFSTDRCGGFEEGVAAVNPSIEYLGAIDVPEDNDLRYKQIVEDHIQNKTADAGDWEGIGILLAGQSQISP